MKKSILIPVIAFAILVVFMAGCESQEKAKEEENKAILRRYTEMWNQGNMDLVDEIIAHNYVIYSDPHDRYDTLNYDAYKKRMLGFLTVYPDTQFSTEDSVFQGDKIWVRWTFRGTHKDKGKQVTVTGMTILHIVDGKIKGHWQNMDRLGEQQQLGIELKPKEVEK